MCIVIVYVYLIGYPLAWRICSQETTEVVKLPFQAIKECSPDVQVCTLMTDDGKLQMNIQYTVLCAMYIFEDDIWYNGGKAIVVNELTQ